MTYSSGNVLTLTCFFLRVFIKRRSKERSQKNRCHPITHWQTVPGRWVVLLGRCSILGADKYRVLTWQTNKHHPLSLVQDVVVHEFATLCLALLSVDYVCKVQIFESTGLPPLIHLLSSPDPDVKKNSLEIIFNMVQVSLIYRYLTKN